MIGAAIDRSIVSLGSDPVVGVGISTIALAGWLGVLAAMKRALHPEDEITVATWITAIRGSIAATLIGCVLIEPSTGLRWVVCGGFLLAAALDRVDGQVARYTDQRSAFGARADTEADALLVLIGSILVVGWGVYAWWFLAVGAVRYGYVVGRYSRKRRGLPIYGGDTRWWNRGMYVLVLFGIAVGLAPPTAELVTEAFALVIVIPFLLNFAHSWLVLTGRA